MKTGKKFTRQIYEDLRITQPWQTSLDTPSYVNSCIHDQNKQSVYCKIISKQMPLPFKNMQQQVVNTDTCWMGCQMTVYS